MKASTPAVQMTNATKNRREIQEAIAELTRMTSEAWRGFQSRALSYVTKAENCFRETATYLQRR
jgi:hypothetical protein